MDREMDKKMENCRHRMHTTPAEYPASDGLRSLLPCLHANAHNTKTLAKSSKEGHFKNLLAFCKIVLTNGETEQQKVISLRDLVRTGSDVFE
jgi:hypothetical protein